MGPVQSRLDLNKARIINHNIINYYFYLNNKIINILLTVNICLRLISDGTGIDSMLKWRMKRGETGFRPPPGGAQAAQIVIS